MITTDERRGKEADSSSTKGDSESLRGFIDSRNSTGYWDIPRGNISNTPTHGGCGYGYVYRYGTHGDTTDLKREPGDGSETSTLQKLYE